MTTPSVAWVAHEVTRRGASAPTGGQWACSARALAWPDRVTIAVRLDITGGRRPREGVPVIVSDVPRTELRTLAAVLTALAAAVDTASEHPAPGDVAA